MRLRTALIAIAAALAPAAPAAAADVSLRVTPAGGVRLGDQTTVTGRVTDAGAPLANRVVRLELRKHPYTGRWRTRASTTTGPDGRYAFSPELDRNHRVRVRLVAVPPSSPYVIPETDTLSARRDAYVLPAFSLAFQQRGTRILRLRQTYTVPRAVRLSAPTRFYVGPCKPDARGECTGTRAPFRAAAETRRVRAGRYVATATVRIPRSYGGRFRYVSCFRYSRGSGMGDPSRRCPRRFFPLR